MEDLSRDVAQDLKKSGRKHKPESSKSWTLLLVGELGNIISLRLSKISLVCVLFLFSLVCTFAIISSFTYFRLQMENKGLRDNLNDATAELLAANKAAEAYQVRLMLLEGKGKPGNNTASEKPLLAAQKNLASGNKNDAPATEKKPRSAFVTAEAAKPKAAVPEQTERSPSRQDSTKDIPDTGSDRETLPDKDGDDEDRNDEDAAVAPVPAEDLLVDNLEIWKQEEGLAVKFQFILKNAGASESKIQGYTFLVLKPEEGSSEVPRGSPWTPLKDGQPTIYKKGQYFSIARFKYVRGTVPQIQDVERFQTATIYVYTESGDLLVEKVFDIDDVLRA